MKKSYPLAARLGAVILGFESIVMLLGGLFIFGMKATPAGIEPWWGIVAGGVMAVLMITYQGKWRACLRNLRQLLWPMIARTAGIPLAPAALAEQASVGNMPYGLAIALGSLAVQGRNYF